MVFSSRRINAVAFGGFYGSFIAIANSTIVFTTELATAVALEKIMALEAQSLSLAKKTGTVIVRSHRQP